MKKKNKKKKRQAAEAAAAEAAAVAEAAAAAEESVAAEEEVRRLRDRLQETVSRYDTRSPMAYTGGRLTAARKRGPAAVLSKTIADPSWPSPHGGGGPQPTRSRAVETADSVLAQLGRIYSTLGMSSTHGGDGGDGGGATPSPSELRHDATAEGGEMPDRCPCTPTSQKSRLKHSAGLQNGHVQLALQPSARMTPCSRCGRRVANQPMG